MKSIYIIIFLILSLSLQAENNDTICFPFPVAKQIAQDLNSCDSLKEENKILQDNYILLQKKSTLQDSTISIMKQDKELYKQRLINMDDKFNIVEQENQSLKSQNKRFKLILGTIKIVIPVSFAAIIGGTIYSIIK